MDDPDAADLDDDTGEYYRAGYGLTRDRIEAADVRTFRRDAGKQFDQLRTRLARDLGDAGRPALEALDAGARNAEAGRPPAW